VAVSSASVSEAAWELSVFVSLTLMLGSVRTEADVPHTQVGTTHAPHRQRGARVRRGQDIKATRRGSRFRRCHEDHRHNAHVSPLAAFRAIAPRPP
jgi:hypothetical protein